MGVIDVCWVLDFNFSFVSGIEILMFVMDGIKYLFGGRYFVSEVDVLVVLWVGNELGSCKIYKKGWLLVLSFDVNFSSCGVLWVVKFLKLMYRIEEGFCVLS